MTSSTNESPLKPARLLPTNTGGRSQYGTRDSGRLDGPPKEARTQKRLSLPPARPKGPKESPTTAKEDPDKKVARGQEAGHDFDLALAALHAGDYDSAAALVEKLRRGGQTDPSSYQLAIVQLALLIQEGRDCAQRHKTRSSALQAFSKQAQPYRLAPPQVDRSV